MKKYLLLFSLFIISVSACKKGDVVSEQAAVDDAKIQAYIKANNINAIKDPSGIYYQILIDGAGPYPVVASNSTTISSTVQVSYTGTFLNGQVFNPNATSTASLSGFVSGFQIGMEHINKGGRILLIIPSALGYGTAGNGGGVPPNAVLVFKVDLIGFY
jgi:FKBP-type peptidyl-prolyl cis-trans isomerase FkpA